MKTELSFTQGKILPALLKFAFPILGAMLLQAMYGAVDLMVVGRFSDAAAVSAVSTGTQLLHTITNIIVGISMGTTVLLGRRIGEGRKDLAGSVIGNAIWLFSGMGVIVMILIPLLANPLCRLLKAPEESLSLAVQYIVICGIGAVFIIAYNVLGSIFRGIGDSKTPLMAVIIACVVNILGDLLFVAVFNMSAAGAALATVIAQAISVLLCLVIIRKRGLPFYFGKESLRVNSSAILDTLHLGVPIALQDFLVSISFLFLLGIVNSLGVISSAGVGLAEKLCGFIMLAPGAFSQSLSAFVAQNIGAGKRDRAKKSMLYGMAASFAIGSVMAYLSFFHGDILCGLFDDDPQVVAAGWDYLKAYAIDTLLTSFLFCFIGYFNGCGKTSFNMVHGLFGAFCIRIPVSLYMSRQVPVSLFRIGLATPCSTSVQILLCFIFYLIMNNHQKKMEASL